MSVLKEFREFAVKGNVIDLAVGVIIGGAFGKIVDSLVNDIVMPLISTLLGGHIDFTNLFIIPEGVPRTFDALKKAGVPVFAYGNFITISINFILLAFVIFQMVKVVNKVRLMDTPPAPPTPFVPGFPGLPAVPGLPGVPALPVPPRPVKFTL